MIFSFILLVALLQGISCEKIKCDHTTPVCECNITVSDNEACEFQMDIEMLQTFTRYVVDTTNGDSRGTAGRVYYIDSNGQWQPTPASSTAPCGEDIPIGDNRCSDPFGVDGYTFRSFIAVNGRIPGPTLIVPQDALVKVNVINRLASESISIHWHGQHQRKSNWMDGVEHVTQCGIPPGASFTYIFKATKHGTHWYHSHSGAQRTDGLFGALIVKESNDEIINDILSDSAYIVKRDGEQYIDSPDQHTLSFLDWQKSNSLDLFTQIHSSIRYFDVDKASNLPTPGVPDRTYSSDGAEVGPVPYWSGLINGRGSYLPDRTKSILSTFQVEPSKIYRFRLIGAQSLFAYRVSIDDHKLIVIATDGVFIIPNEVDYIIIHSGERYDFLLKTKSMAAVSSKSVFAIHGVTLEANQTTKELLGKNVAEAILYYKLDDNTQEPTGYNTIFGGTIRNGDPDKRSCTDEHKCVALNCPFEKFPLSYNTTCTHIHQLDIHPDEDVSEKISARSYDVPDANKYFFNFGFEGALQTSTINARNLKLPSSPPAVVDSNKWAEVESKEYCSDTDKSDMCDYDNTNGNNVTSPECVCTHVRNIDYDKTIQLVLSAVGPNPNDTANFLFAHPVHLHGHYFHVVDIKFGQYDSNLKLEGGNTDIDCGGTYLCTNPSWKTGKGYAISTARKKPTKAPLKDTILIPAGGYAVVYFQSNNPGWWFLHCHIEVHQLEGMGVIINEGSRNDKNSAPDFMNKCGNFSFTIAQYNKATGNGSSMINFGPATVIAGLLLVVAFYF